MQCYWLLVTNITVRFLQYPITITNIHVCLPHYPVIQKTNVRNIIDVSLNRIKDYKQWAKYVSPESSWEGLFCPLYEEWSLCCILHQIFQQGTLLLRHHLLQIGPFQYSKWILFFDQVTQKISRLAEKKNHRFSSHTWLLLELSYALRAKLIMFVDRSIPRTWAWYVWNKTISWYRTVVTQMCMAIPLI